MPPSLKERMQSSRWIPIALGLFGVGMTVGNLLGGRLADGHADPEQAPVSYTHLTLPTIYSV